MLVKFTSSTSGQMIMFSNNAHELFKMMGKSPAAQGVFEHETLQDAVANLKKAIALELSKTEQTDDPDKENLEQNEEPVTLGQRAQPMIRLMENTWKEGGFILWEAPEAF